MILSFISTVVIYKILGAFIWAIFFNNVLLSRLIQFISPFANGCYLWQFEALSLAILPLVMYSFIKTLRSIPTPISLLHLSEFASLLFWIFCYWAYLYLAASASVDNPDSIIISTVVCIFTVYNQNHAFYFTFVKQSRFQRFCHSFHSHFITSIILGIILTYFFGFVGFLSTFQLFLCSDVIFSITTVVASEPVSFSSPDNKRLIRGLNSKNSYERYLSFQDLYAISGGNKLRRNFLFVDPSGHVFSLIVDSCSKLIISFCHRQEKMIQMGNSKTPIHRVNDGQWRRSQINRYNGIQIEEIKEKPSLFERIKKFFFPRKVHKDSKYSERLIRESDALEYSTLVLLSVQSLVRFLFILPKEDKYGVGQIKQQITLSFLLLMIKDGLLTVL